MRLFPYITMIAGVVLLLSGNSLFSQNFTDSISYKSATRLNVFLQANSYNDLEINNTAGKELLNSGQTLTPELGVSLSQNLWNNWGISFGGSATVIPFNVNFNFDLKKHSPLYDESYFPHFYDYVYFIADYTLHAGVFKTIHWKENYSFYFETGAKLNRIWPYKINVWVKNVFGLYLISPSQDWMTHYSYYGKFGLLRHNKRNLNHWSLSLVYQYSPDVIGSGEYEFTNLYEPSRGEIELGLNYLGLEFLYAFNMVKKTALPTEKSFSKTYYDLNEKTALQARAAEHDTIDDKSLYLKASVGGLGFNKIKIAQPEMPYFYSDYAYSPLFSVGVAYSLKNNWILNGGVEYKQHATKLIKKVDFINVIVEDRDNVFSVPISIQKLFYRKNLWFWSVYGGLTYNRIKNRGGYTGNLDRSNYVENDIGKQWGNTVGIFVKGGLFKKMKNEQFMEFNLVAHYTPFKIEDISYKTDIREGTYTVGLNYIGVELLYGFRLWD